MRVRLSAIDEAAVRSRLQATPNVRLVEALLAPGYFVVESDEGPASAIRSLVEAGLAVEEATRCGNDLEDLFLRLTEGARR